MQLAAEGPRVPDVRDAEEEEEAHFNEFIDKAYRLRLTKPCRRMHAVTFIQKRA